MKQVVLHSSWACPLCKGLEIALKLKGISFTLVPENLFNPSLVVRKLSPLSPFESLLLHDGEAISGHRVIMEYIDERWKGKTSIFPKSPKDRAKARSLITFIFTKCMPAVMSLCWDRGWAPARTAALRNANSYFQVLEDELSNGNKYFGGDSIGVVDICGVFIAVWAGVHAEANAIKLPKLDGFPFLCKWVDRFLSNTIVKETIPSRAMLLSYYRKINPGDFRQPRKKIIDDAPHESKMAEGDVEEESGDCYGILRKLFNRRKLCNHVFPAESPM